MTDKVVDHRKSVLALIAREIVTLKSNLAKTKRAYNKYDNHEDMDEIVVIEREISLLQMISKKIKNKEDLQV